MRKEVKAGESRAFEGRAGVTKAGRGQLSSCRLKSVLRPAPRKRTRAERACGRQEGPSRAVNLSLMGEEEEEEEEASNSGRGSYGPLLRKYIMYAPIL